LLPYQPLLRSETHPYGHPRFLENVSAAYGLLHTSITGSPLKGVTGADVTQLLGMLVSELPPPTADALLRPGPTGTNVMDIVALLIRG
jgi:hypothetical protein